MTVADKSLTPATAHRRQTYALGMALGLVEFACAQGADRGRLLAMIGLDPDGDHDPNRRIALDRFAAMLCEAERQCNDLALAVRFAEKTDFADLSIVGLIGYASATMRDALDQLNRFGRLVSDVVCAGPVRFELKVEPDGLWLIDRRIDLPPFPQLSETTFVRMVCGTRQFGDTPFASMAEFAHQDRGAGDEIRRALGCPVRFGARRNALRVSMEWQEYRIALYPRYAFGLFCAQADQLLAELGQDDTMARRLEGVILPVLHTGAVTLKQAARALGLSEKGLYRALQKEGTVFEQVLAQLRQRLARGYLERQRASLSEIAYLLGYSDVSAFSRAFKRAEGVAPGGYRRAFIRDHAQAR